MNYELLPVPVTWQSAPAFDCYQPGTYIFTATVTEVGFTLLAASPVITIAVGPAPMVRLVITPLSSEIGYVVLSQSDVNVDTDSVPLYIQQKVMDQVALLEASGGGTVIVTGAVNAGIISVNKLPVVLNIPGIVTV